MNFLPASLLSADDDRTFGIRPEDLNLSDSGPIKAVVQHVEHLGGDTNVIARTDEKQITARLFGQHDVPAGHEITLNFPLEKALYFDKDGKRA